MLKENKGDDRTKVKIPDTKNTENVDIRGGEYLGERRSVLRLTGAHSPQGM